MLELLLASHHASNPAMPLLVHAIGWPQSKLVAASAAYPNAKFQDQPATTDTAAEEMKGPVPRSASILKLKVEYFYRAHKECNGSVVWVDADTLLLEPVLPMIQRIEKDGDFGVTERAGKRAHARFAVAVMCFTQTQVAQKLMHNYAELTRQSDGLHKRRDVGGVPWFHDQLALWQSYRQLSRGILGLPKRGRPRLVQLSDAEHSLDGTDRATFVSRRDETMNIEHMRSLLVSRGIEIKTI